jgi:hypothetical protein
VVTRDLLDDVVDANHGILDFRFLICDLPVEGAGRDPFQSKIANQKLG